VKPHRLVLLAAMAGCVGLGALAPSTGCNGTGTTPTCDFPDGANNPESGCGELVEAAPPSADGTAPDVVEEPAPKGDGPIGNPDASDATLPEDAADSSIPDAHDAHEDTSDAKGDHATDAPEDAKKG
jgi:hypothetical protein